YRGNPRRWAGWFLEVADETDGFFRTPIGHPALEVVTPETRPRRVEPDDVKPICPTPVTPSSATVARTEESVRQMAAYQQMRVQLLKDNRRLRRELSAICLASEGVRLRANRLVSLARAAGPRY